MSGINVLLLVFIFFNSLAILALFNKLKNIRNEVDTNYSNSEREQKYIRIDLDHLRNRLRASDKEFETLLDYLDVRIEQIPTKREVVKNG